MTEDTATGARGLTQVEWLAEYDRVRNGPWSDIQDHLPFLHTAAINRPAIAELGVRYGNSTAALLAAAALGEGHVWSVDIAPAGVPLAWHQDPRWSFAQCDSVSAQAAAFLPATIDLLLIDSSHTYEATLAELRAYARRVRRRSGLIACHDTQWDEGDRHLPAPGGPVTAALDDYCAETGLKWTNRPSGAGGYGLGVIWP